VAPPLLQDRGLTAALQGLALSSAMPVRAEIDPALDGVVSPEVARTVYFIVAELLTNALKHSGASGTTLRAWVAPGAVSTLDVWVVDDGRGGARVSQGHGLEGVDERVRGLRGLMEVHSPLGGPTRIGVHIPLATAPARA
jgi:signal transduction histidine kinase